MLRGAGNSVTTVDYVADIIHAAVAPVFLIGSGFSIFLVETRIASRAARIRAELLEHQPELEG